MFKQITFALTCLVFSQCVVLAQKPGTVSTPPTAVQTPGPSTVPPPPPPLPATANDSVTVTVVLKHQQDKNLMEIRRKLEANGFWDLFPPKGSRVVSWNIVMGMGQVVTLRLTANDVRTLNLAIQNGAWGAYDTEIYLTYDYLPIWLDFVEKREETKADNDKN